MKKLILIYMFLAVSSVLTGQTLKTATVSGTVYDDIGEPMIGATVTLRDIFDKGVITDTDGTFKIKATEGDVLVITAIGFKKYEYMILKDVEGLKVNLTIEENILSEAIVTGMGSSQRKISIVGAVTTVDVSQIQTPATSVVNMMAGRIPGIIGVQKSGEPGQNVSEFWVRGIGTFGANASALILIDGIEGDLNNIDPADIESFSVLKDASATAVYGVRGANGVVIVTTKRGTTDKLHISARVNMTVSHLNRMPTYLGAYDYAKLANEARMVRGEEALYDDIELNIIKHQLDPDLYPDVNWRKEILNPTSLQKTYYISARGGGSLARYFLSLGMSDESAAYKQDETSKYKKKVGFDKITYRSNIDMDLTKTTNLYFGIDGEFTKRSRPGMSDTNALWYTQARLTPLLQPTRYSSGHLAANSTERGGYSPYVMLNHTGLQTDEYTNNNISLALNQNLSFIAKGLTIRSQVALTQRTWFDQKREMKPEQWKATDRDINGNLDLKLMQKKESVKYSKSQNQFRKLHFETTINYETIIATDHRFSALAYYYMSDEKEANFGDNTLDALPLRAQGLSGRVTYGLKDTYFMDVNFGYTGSENFQKGHRFGFFPSIAGGWIPTAYDFMKENLPWLNHLKIRASYGLVGNSRISNKRFPYLTQIEEGVNTGWGFEEKGIREKYTGADNLRWEKAKKTNIGIEAKLFDSKLDFVVDFFNDQRDGIFQERQQIPSFVGLINMPYSNVGRMRSWGSDGSISFTHIIDKDMSFVLRANFTHSQNEIQNWETSFRAYDYQYAAPFSFNVRRGYIALGLFKDQEDIDNSPKQFDFTYMPGDIKYKDVNGDGVISGDDEVPISYGDTPRLQYGFGGEFNYKAFTLGLLFKGTGRTDFYWTQNNWGVGYIPFLDGEYGNVLDIANLESNRWIPAEYSGTKDTENPNARFPRLSYGNNHNNNRTSTFWKGDSKYLRLSEISLNYTLRHNWLKKVGVNKMDIQFVGSDLLVWDNVKLWDPELAPSVGQAYPIPGRYTLQLYIHF